MNKTRKLTQGAMYLAIVGAIMLLDKQIGSIFADSVSVIITVAVYCYYCSTGLKMAYMLEICILIISLINGNITTYIYAPFGIIVSSIMCLASQKRNLNKSEFFKILCVANIVGEFVVSLVVYPLMGTSLTQQVQGSINILNALHIPGAEILAIASLVIMVIIIGISESIITTQLIEVIYKRTR